jgi:hypothetical protein
MSAEGYVTINTVVFWDVHNNSNFPTYLSNVAEILKNYNFIGPADGALRPCKESVKFHQITRCHVSYDSNIQSPSRKHLITNSNDIQLRNMKLVMSFLRLIRQAETICFKNKLYSSTYYHIPTNALIISFII